MLLIPLHSHKLKYLVIFFTFLSLYLTYTVIENVHKLNYKRHVLKIKTPVKLAIDKNSNEDNHFLVNTSACKIPRSDTINDRILPLMNMSSLRSQTREPYCFYVRDRYRPPLVGSQENTLYIIHDSIRFYTNHTPRKVKCYYRPFWKGGPDDGKYIKFGKKSAHFINSTTIPSTVEFTRVRCKVGKRLVYEDYHAFVPQKQTSQMSFTSPQVNVIVFGMDALSRVNFHRQMPNTKRVLDQLNFIEYFGYNKLADNTFPNLIPLLSGYTVPELRSECWPYVTNYFDKCPFVWQKYKQHNYTTAFIEEQSYLALFRFGRSGFVKSPTDYYYYTFDRAASLAIAHTGTLSTNFCLGSRLSAQMLLDYSTKLIETMRNSTLFSFIWEVSLSHDDLNLPRISDPIHEKFFTTLYDLKATENSVIIFMGDHGIRHGKILEMFEGFLEERLPLFMASFPNWFPEKYPLAYANFKANARRLTTHFDTHETLNDLVDLNNIRDDVIRRRTSNLNELSEIPRGISLFLPIPETRTCEQADIPFIYCTCMRTGDKSQLDSNFVKNIGFFLVEGINKLIKGFKECARLRLKKVKNIQFVKMHHKKDFILATVLTLPGDGVFQALIRYTDETQRKMAIDGDITRTNVYGNQSRCVNVPEMKLYCYCI